MINVFTRDIIFYYKAREKPNNYAGLSKLEHYWLLPDKISNKKTIHIWYVLHIFNEYTGNKGEYKVLRKF